jgi:hypothetical protein
MCAKLMSMHVRASYRLAVAVTAIGLVLAVQIGGAAHEASVRHVACAQHGEMLEAPDVDPVPAGETRLVRAGGGGGHDHCAVSGALRQHGVTSSTAAIATVAVVVTETPAMAIETRHADLALYRLAPKTSPPETVFVHDT